MSDIYLSLTETPSVVTLSQPVIASSVAATVTVGNTVTVALDANSLSALENVTVTVGAAISVSNFPATQVVSVGNFPASQVVTGTVALDSASLAALENVTVTVGAAVTVAGFSTSSLPPSTVTVGNSVTIGNFPSTQTIAGTVTANGFDFNNSTYNPIPLAPFDETVGGGKAVVAKVVDSSGNELNWSAGNVPISGTVTVGNSVTIGSLPAISGTVTANLRASAPIGVEATPPTIGIALGYGSDANNFFQPVTEDLGFPVRITAQSQTQPISGTVTVGNSVTIGSVPNGSLTTRFGTPTTANVSFATSAVTNANRKYLLIQNVTTGSNVITVGIGFTPTTTQGIQLTAGAGITFESSYIPTGAVYVLSSVTASNFTILEA